MLALSLTSRYLTGTRDDDPTDLWRALLGTPDEGLARLSSLGVAAIEVGDVRDASDTSVAAEALAAVRRAGLRPHAHLWLPDGFDADRPPATLERTVRAVGASVDGASARPAACAVHGRKRHEPDASKATVRDLTRLEPWLRAAGVTAALEVCRYRPEGPFGGTYAEVTAVVRAAEDLLGTPLGVTWDIGHTTWNHLQGHDSQWPDEAFTTRVAHVHVHDVGASGRTHFPLDEGRAPLALFVERLKGVGYDGLWNLELYPERWPGTVNERRDRLVASIATLVEAVS